MVFKRPKRAFFTRSDRPLIVRFNDTYVCVFVHTHTRKSMYQRNKFQSCARQRECIRVLITYYENYTKHNAVQPTNSHCNVEFGVHTNIYAAHLCERSARSKRVSIALNTLKSRHFLLSRACTAVQLFAQMVNNEIAHIRIEMRSFPTPPTCTIGRGASQLRYTNTHLNCNSVNFP